MAPDNPADRVFMDRAIESFIRIALIAILAAWCFEIVRPFIVPIVWGVIIAIGLYSGHQRLTDLLGGRSASAAATVAILMLAVLLVPVVLLSASVVDGAELVLRDFESGGLRVPPPPDSVSQIPLVGDSVHDFWVTASSNLESALAQIAPQLKEGLHWLGGLAAGAGIGLLQFVLAIAIAGVLLAHAEGGQAAVLAVARRLAGVRGLEFTRLAEATVRSVTRGILGVALIQSILAGLGWLVVGVPGAGLWALLALLLSTVQIGILPITIPILIYVFTHTSTLTFVLFLIWSILVGSIDNVLKPILLGRGVQVPMTVIFIGAIGGFLSSGIIGLFVGAVVLVLGYKLFLAWLDGGMPESVEVLPRGVERSGTDTEGGRT